MNKKDFFQILSKELMGIPEEERRDILAEYEEHFEAGVSRGRTEEDILNSVGNPVIIAKELKAATLIRIAEKESSIINISRAAFSTIGLGIFNLIFVLVPFLAVMIILVILFTSAIGIIALGIAVIIALISEPLISEYVVIGMKIAPAVFLSIGSIATGVIFFIGNMELVKILYRLFIRYIRFNVRILANRRQRDEI